MTLTRLERNAFVTTTPTDIAYAEGACVETPPRLFELLHKRFRFDVDLTANAGNHLLPNWFGPGAVWSGEDALTADWRGPHGAHVPYAVQWKTGFSNPPYGPFIPKILKKAIEERDKGFTSVFLLPMRASGWFRDLVLPQYSELWYCSERIVFHYQGKPKLSAVLKRDEMQKSPLLAQGPDGASVVIHSTQPYQTRWRDTWDTVWSYEFFAGDIVKQPAGALFDSIIVVYAPYDRSKWGLFPPPQRPNIFEVKTGELRF